MQKTIDCFISWRFGRERGSQNTEVSYRRDLEKMAAYLAKSGIDEVLDVRVSDLEGYLDYMRGERFADSTISRTIASIRAFFSYLYTEGQIPENPALAIRNPRVLRFSARKLSSEEAVTLVNQPGLHSPKGIRDTAMLLLLARTGMKVSELIDLKLDDFQPEHACLFPGRDGFRQRLPLDGETLSVLELYLATARWTFLQGRLSPYLFTNCRGEKISRQGFWKLLKGYGGETISPVLLKSALTGKTCRGKGCPEKAGEMLLFKEGQRRRQG